MVIDCLVVTTKIYGINVKRYKICVIGAGSASAICMLTLMGELGYNNISLNCIYDPNTPITTVGESISIKPIMLMQDLLKFNFDRNGQELDMTIRYGTQHTFENNLGKSFIANYGNNLDGTTAIAHHINSEKFSSYVINNLKKHYSFMFKAHEDVVLDLRNENRKVLVICEKFTHEYDYVIDCRGTPSTEMLESDLYAKPDYETVNSVLIYPEFKSYDDKYTTAHFHENGWMFGIPLQHRKAFGYLYNNKITTKENAIEHFQTMKPQIEIEKLRSITWSHYYRKKVMDGRIMYMGNNLYFFEPAMGLPLHHFHHMTSVFCTFLKSSFLPELDVSNFMNVFHEGQMEILQDLIAINYSGNHNMKTEFWQKTSNQTKNRLKNSIYFQDYIRETLNNKKYGQYWCFLVPLMQTYLEGFDVNIEDLITQSAVI